MTSQHKTTELFDLKEFAENLVLKHPPLPLLNEHPAGPAPHFIQHLDNLLEHANKAHTLLLPNLHLDVESLAVFSDYGGEHKGSRYRTYSALVAGWNTLQTFHTLVTQLREEYGLDNPYKEIAFKDLRYGPLRAALPKLLRIADGAVLGLLCTLVVDTSLVSIIGRNSYDTAKEINKALQDVGLCAWNKRAVAEKVLRVVHLAAYFTTLLARDGHKIFWMTDHDAIAADDDSHAATVKLFQRVLTYYCATRKYGTIGYAIPFERREDDAYDLKDLLSLCDLAAGSLASWFTDFKDGEPEAIRTTTNELLLWHCGQGIALKKLVIKLDANEADGMHASLTVFERKETPQDLQIIEIEL